MYKTPNFDKLQNLKKHILYNITGFLGTNYENIALFKDFRIVKNLENETSLFCSNQTKIQEIDHSGIYQ